MCKCTIPLFPLTVLSLRISCRILSFSCTCPGLCLSVISMSSYDATVDLMNLPLLLQGLPASQLIVCDPMFDLQLFWPFLIQHLDSTSFYSKIVEIANLALRHHLGQKRFLEDHWWHLLLMNLTVQSSTNIGAQVARPVDPWPSMSFWTYSGLNLQRPNSMQQSMNARFPFNFVTYA